MRIGFIVGEVEKHQMEFSFDQISGDLRILMDGAQVLQDCPVLAPEPVRTYELAVGDAEKHRLAFELTYGEVLTELGIPATPRLSLMISPMIV